MLTKCKQVFLKENHSCKKRKEKDKTTVELVKLDYLLISCAHNKLKHTQTYSTQASFQNDAKMIAKQQHPQSPKYIPKSLKQNCHSFFTFHFLTSLA